LVRTNPIWAAETADAAQSVITASRNILNLRGYGSE
jgi:hypothetical protein